MYGWLIKHTRSGQFGVVEIGEDGPVITVTADPERATMFATRGQAVDVVRFMEGTSRTFPACDVVDYTTRDAPPADADAEPVRSLAQLLADVHAGGEERRTAHAAARKAHRERPNARLIPKPTSKEN